MRKSPLSAPLAGLTVLVARPVGRTASLARRLRAQGATAVALPVASIRTTEDPDLARRALRAARSAHAAVFTSPAAVRCARALAPALHFARGTHVLGVGPATVRALRRAGLHASHPPQRYDSEGLLDLPALADVGGRRVVLVTAPGGRGTLAHALQERGARVEQVHVYRRALPRWSRLHLERLRAAPAPRVLLLSSGEALAALRALLPAADWRRLTRDRVLAGSERVAQLARDAGFARAGAARSAIATDLMDALLRSRAKRR